MKIRFNKSSKKFQLDARSIAPNYQPTFATKAEAEAKRDQLTADKVGGVFISPTTAVTFDVCIASWLAANEKRVQFGDIGEGEFANMTTSAKHISKFVFSNKLLTETKVSDLRAGPLAKLILPQIRADRAQATAHKLLVHFKAIFKDAVLSEFIAYDPARDLKLPKKLGATDVEDITAARSGKNSLAQRIASNNVKKIIGCANEKFKRQIEMIAFTGVRVGELRAATWSQVEFGDADTGATITIDRAIKKGGKLGDPKTYAGHRTIALDDDLVAMLREWKMFQPLDQRQNDLIFPNKSGAVADGDNWRNRGMVAACKDANVEAVTLRELRHHFASILIFDESYTEATVTELMGHTDINFTKKQYATWLQSAKRDKTISAKLTASRRAS